MFSGKLVVVLIWSSSSTRNGGGTSGKSETEERDDMWVLGPVRQWEGETQAGLIGFWSTSDQFSNGECWAWGRSWAGGFGPERTRSGRKENKRLREKVWVGFDLNSAQDRFLRFNSFAN